MCCWKCCKSFPVYSRQIEIKAFAGILKGKVHASSDGRKYYLTSPVLLPFQKYLQTINFNTVRQLNELKYLKAYKHDDKMYRLEDHVRVLRRFLA